MLADRFLDRKHSASGGIWVACVLAGVAVLVPMLTNGRYGYFRDELYDWRRGAISPLAISILPH